MLQREDQYETYSFFSAISAALLDPEADRIPAALQNVYKGTGQKIPSRGHAAVPPKKQRNSFLHPCIRTPLRLAPNPSSPSHTLGNTLCRERRVAKLLRAEVTCRHPRLQEATPEEAACQPSPEPRSTTRSSSPSAPIAHARAAILLLPRSFSSSHATFATRSQVSSDSTRPVHFFLRSLLRATSTSTRIHRAPTLTRWTPPLPPQPRARQ